MFKTDAEKFLNASNSLNYAKTLINECKRLIGGEIVLQGNPDYIRTKNYITYCDIDGLVDKVETTKENLMKLDKDFADEYMTLVQEYLQTSSIDTSRMTEEERMQYSVEMNGYAREYNTSLLYMLEKYEDSGRLTSDMKKQLEMQRVIVEQYDVQDQMAALKTTSQEYIDLFKKNAEYDKELINLNPNLPKEEKENYLKDYEDNFNSTLEILELERDVAKKTNELKKLEEGSEAYYKKENEIKQIQINYYQKKDNLTATEKEKLEFLRDGVELNELYIDREKNNGFFHPFVESEYSEAILDKKIEMNIATEAEIAYDKMNGWERAWENTKAFSTSAVLGIGSVTENVIDGGAMLTGEFLNLFGVDTQWAEDFVSIHYADDAYTGLVQSDCINSVAAYSGWHTAGNVVGTTVGYAALSYLPGGSVGTGATGGLAAMGSTSQRALDSGATFHEAFGTGTIAFSAGAFSGWKVGNLGKAASSATSLAEVGKYTLAGMGVSTLEPIVNTVAEYNIYADEMVDEKGNKVYDNFWEYYVNSGGLTNTMMAAGAGGISVGGKAYGGYKYNQKVEISRNNALDYYKNNKPAWMSDAEFDQKVARADAAAKQLEQDGILKRDKFYEVWGTPKGDRPDPSTYLSDKYIKKHIAQFEENGAARLVDGNTYDKRVKTNGGKVGNPLGSDGKTIGGYNVGEKHYDYSEFMSTKSSVDNILNKASKSTDFELSIKNDLGLGDYDLENYRTFGIKRYDVSSENLSSLNMRIPSGNEPGAFFLDWIPGGKTSGGSLEIVIDSFNLNDIGNKLTTIR